MTSTRLPFLISNAILYQEDDELERVITKLNQVYGFDALVPDKLEHIAQGCDKLAIALRDEAESMRNAIREMTTASDGGL